MKACLGAEELRSYCECGWGVFSSQTTAEQLHANRATQADLDRIQEVTVKRCGEKLPEPWVQSGFVRTCSRGQDSNQPYCGCVWTELRRRLGVGDLALGQPTDNPRFMIASRDSARACSSSLLPSSVQAAFVEGCTKGRSGADAFCSCAYRELTAVMSLGEVELATSTQSPDFIAAQQRVERICGKLKPRP